MAEIHFIIQNIKDKAEKIVQKNKRLQSENIELQQRNTELEKALGLQRETIKDLEEKNKMLKIAHSIGQSEEDKKALKLQINAFIREIDKSMSLLND